MGAQQWRWVPLVREGLGSLLSRRALGSGVPRMEMGVVPPAGEGLGGVPRMGEGLEMRVPPMNAELGGSTQGRGREGIEAS